jgi:hypothetical protein
MAVTTPDELLSLIEYDVSQLVTMLVETRFESDIDNGGHLGGMSVRGYLTQQMVLRRMKSLVYADILSLVIGRVDEMLREFGVADDHGSQMTGIEYYDQFI